MSVWLQSLGQFFWVFVMGATNNLECSRYLLKEVVAPLHASQVVLDGEEGQLPADPPPVRQRKQLALNGNASLKLAFGNFSILLAFFLDVPSRQQGAAGHI